MKYNKHHLIGETLEKSIDNRIEKLDTESGKSDLPQTSLLTTIPVNRWDAEMYIATLESDYRVWSGFETETGKARAAMAKHHLEMAKKLFGIPVNLTEPGGQAKIEQAYNTHKD